VGDLLMSYRKRRESDKLHDVGRPDANGDSAAVRAGVATALRRIHSGVLHEELPDRIAELLKQLDQHQTDRA
jgi:Anti-sigma factor NepR